jgi:hypothetical protein
MVHIRMHGPLVALVLARISTAAPAARERVLLLIAGNGCSEARAAVEAPTPGR